MSDETVNETGKASAMEQAIEAVKQGETIRGASKRFNVSLATLSRHVKRAGVGVSRSHETADETPPADETATVNETDLPPASETEDVPEVVMSETPAGDEAAFQENETDVPAMDETDLPGETLIDETPVPDVSPDGETVSGSETLSFGEQFRLTEENERLQSLTNFLQGENEELKANLEAVQNELATLRESAAPAPAFSGEGEPAGEETAGGVTYGDVSYPWSTIKELKEWLDSMGENASTFVDRAVTWRVAYNDWQATYKAHDEMKGHLVRLCRRYVEMRKHYDPGYDPHWIIPKDIPEKDKEDYKYELEAYVIANTDDLTPPAPAKKEKDPGPVFPEKFTQQDRDKLNALADQLPPEDYSPRPSVKDIIDNTPMTIQEIQAERAKANRKKTPVPALNEMNRPAVEVVKEHARTVEDERLGTLAEQLKGESIGMQALLVVAWPVIWAMDRLQHRN
ncbi:MAG: hypothetical protein M0Z67_04280 [Nitrospiraceae bacterium]|nr:hypothetical protein [Nitrospiraceae bacterium]